MAGRLKCCIITICCNPLPQIYSQPPHSTTYPTDEARMNAYFQSLGCEAAAAEEKPTEDPYAKWWALDLPPRAKNSTALALIHEAPAQPRDVPQQVRIQAC